MAENIAIKTPKTPLKATLFGRVVTNDQATLGADC